jgi:hypothetical protein
MDTEKKNLCNLRNLWFLFFIRLLAWPRPHEGLPYFVGEAGANKKTLKINKKNMKRIEINIFFV